jgi:hypothetical protein
VATPVPITAGMPYSRATIEPCASAPPTSVTSPTACEKSGVQAGVVVVQTRMVPGCIWSKSATVWITLAGAVTRPLLTAYPSRIAPMTLPIGRCGSEKGEIDRPELQAAPFRHRWLRREPFARFAERAPLLDQRGEFRHRRSLRAGGDCAADLSAVEVVNAVGIGRGCRRPSTAPPTPAPTPAKSARRRPCKTSRFPGTARIDWSISTPSGTAPRRRFEPAAVCATRSSRSAAICACRARALCAGGWVTSAFRLSKIGRGSSVCVGSAKSRL